MKFTTIKFLAIFLVAISVEAVDYCKLCSNHVACNNNGQFSKNCPSDAKMASLSSASIQTLLNKHNSYRNKIAGGGENRFNTAKQMMKLVRQNY